MPTYKMNLASHRNIYEHWQQKHGLLGLYLFLGKKVLSQVCLFAVFCFCVVGFLGVFSPVFIIILVCGYTSSPGLADVHCWVQASFFHIFYLTILV